MNRRVVGLGAACALLLAPQVAEAHLVVTGMGPLYDGITHFALSPEDSLPVIALAFYAGLQGPLHTRTLLGVLPAAWIAGGLLIAATGIAPQPVLAPAATAMLLLGVGILLASNFGLPSWACALVALALGVLRGGADAVGVAMSGSTAIDLLGMAASVFTLFALAASVTLPLKRFWMIVAARVSGSWLAAVGLLLAGWVIRYGARVQ